MEQIRRPNDMPVRREILDVGKALRLIMPPLPDLLYRHRAQRSWGHHQATVAAMPWPHPTVHASRHRAIIAPAPLTALRCASAHDQADEGAGDRAVCLGASGR